MTSVIIIAILNILWKEEHPENQSDCDNDDESKNITFSGKPSLRESRVRLKALFDYNPFVS